MKKPMMLLLAVAVCFGAVACGDSTDKKETIYDNEDGNSIFELESGTDVLIEKLPYEKITYHGSTFSVSGVQLFQGKTEHGYVPVVILDFNIDDLSEDEIYWLEKDFSTDFSGGFNVYVTVSDKKNNIDDDRMYLMGDEFNKEHQYIIFQTYDEYRYNLYDMSVDVVIRTEQDETYMYDEEGREKAKNKLNEYSFTVNGDGGISEEVLDMDW